jgi:universal stress protein E
MDKPRRILAAIPPTAIGPRVAQRAAMLARCFGAELLLAASVYDPYVAGERFADSPELAAARDALVAQRRAELEQLAAGLRSDQLSVTVQALWAYPLYSGLVTAAEQYGADLLVAGTFHHSLLQRWTLSNTDWQLLRHAPCPVLLVRRDEFAGYADILAAVDPMHAHDKPGALDDRLLEAAGMMGAAFDSRLHVLHCYMTGEQIPLVAPGAGIPARFYDRQSPARAHEKALQALVARHGLGNPEILLESGDARQLIPMIAQRCSAGLVVMGAVSRSRLGQLLIGSTAESVLDGLDCDVLVLKPAGST